MNHIENLEKRRKELLELQLKQENSGSSNRDLTETRRKLDLTNKLIEIITPKQTRKW